MQKITDDKFSLVIVALVALRNTLCAYCLCQIPVLGTFLAIAFLFHALVIKNGEE